MERNSLIEWATNFVPDKPAGQKKRFREELTAALKNWREPAFHPGDKCWLLRTGDAPVACVVDREHDDPLTPQLEWILKDETGAEHGPTPEGSLLPRA